MAVGRGRFDTLKPQFVKYPVLALYNPEQETHIEVDVSGYTTGGVLAQLQDDGKWHPIAYHSESMSDIERNYEIYDKEMLAIICALETWHHYLEGLPQRFKIQSNHENLVFWHMAQHLTHRQARWALYLSHFDSAITHKPGTLNGRADALSCCVDHCADDVEDNLAQVVLQPEHIRILAVRRGHASVVVDKALLHKIWACPMHDE